MRFIKTVALLLLIGLAAIAYHYATRRASACQGGGQLMSTKSECLAWGVDAQTCQAALDEAKDKVAKSAPRSDTSFKCELRFSECVALADGAFVPRPSFCLQKSAAGATPADIRYLEYESDRMNRKKTREIRVD